MSSKNDKPVNTPVNTDKETQATFTPEINKPISDEVANNQKSTNLDSNNPALDSVNDIPASTVKPSASTTTNNAISPSDSAAKNDTSKANDTLTQSAKPITANNTETTKKTTNSTVNSNKTTNMATGSHKGNGSTPPPPTKPNTPKRSPLPLIISLIALGVGGYALYNSMQMQQKQQSHHPEEIQKLQIEVTDLRKAISEQVEQTDKNDITELHNNISNLETQLVELQKLPAPTPGLDEAQIQALITEQVTQVKQSLQDALASLPPPKAQPELSKEQVSTMIKEALINNTAENGNTQPVIDFSNEINTIKQDKADIEQYLQLIIQQGELLKSSLYETVEQATSNLNEAANQVEQKVMVADQQPIVYPLINALTLANIASNAHQYGIANQYLQQAKASFDDLHLNQQPYAQFADQIDELSQKTEELAKQQDSQQEIDSIINSVSNWPFISTNPENVLDNKPADKPTKSWKDDIKHIGHSILSSTVTITKNDAAGLTWVNENPHLQQIIRENVRLDLAMIRNALLIGDQERAQQIASTLHEEVARYFNTDAGEVQQAMNKLGELTQQKSDAPDIATLIKSIQQAG